MDTHGKGEKWSMKDHEPMAKPKDIDGYLEVMSRVIFSAGLNWTVIEKKWSGIKELFVNFSVEKVAGMNDIDREELMRDSRMIRSLPKINAIIKNAGELIKIEKEFGSIENYLTETKKSGEEALIKDLGKKFSFLGPSTATMFLFGSGVDMPEAMKKMHH